MHFKHSINNRFLKISIRLRLVGLLLNIVEKINAVSKAALAALIVNLLIYKMFLLFKLALYYAYVDYYIIISSKYNCLA